MATRKKASGRPSAGEQSVPKGNSGDGTRPTKTNRPKDSVKSRAGKASAAARKAKREAGDPIKRPCSARRANGEPCGNSAIRGGTVCVAHGGRAPQVRAKANMRLLNMVEPALRELRRIIDDDNADDANKLRAINMVLNRTGFAEKQNLEIGLRPPTEWDNLLQGGALTFDRGELDPSPSRPALGGGGSEDEDDYDLSERRKLARDEAERETYLSGLDDADIVIGEVVDSHPAPTKGSRTYRGHTTAVGPIDFPATGDPRNAGATEYDPEPGGRYSRRTRSQRDLYEDPEGS